MDTETVRASIRPFRLQNFDCLDPYSLIGQMLTFILSLLVYSVTIYRSSFYLTVDVDARNCPSPSRPISPSSSLSSAHPQKPTFPTVALYLGWTGGSMLHQRVNIATIKRINTLLTLFSTATQTRHQSCRYLWGTILHAKLKQDIPKQYYFYHPKLAMICTCPTDWTNVDFFLRRIVGFRPLFWLLFRYWRIQVASIEISRRTKSVSFP